MTLSEELNVRLALLQVLVLILLQWRRHDEFLREVPREQRRRFVMLALGWERNIRPRDDVGRR